MENQPDIIIVEACKPERGDLLVLMTNESLSTDMIYAMRGRLAEEFDSYGIDFLIVTGATMVHFKKDEISETIEGFINNLPKEN